MSDPILPWKPPTFLERYGELIAAGIGLLVLGAAAGMVIFAAVLA